MIATLQQRRTARLRRRSACAAGAAALLAAGPSRALEWSYTPAATVSAQYDTNIRLQFDGAEPVNGRSVSGAADIVGRNEGVDFRFTPRVSAQRYDDPSIEDRNFQYADLSISTHNERQRWSLGGNYALEGTRNSEFESNGFPAIDLERRQTGLTTSWTRLMERGRFDIAASATSVNYQQSLSSPYRDYRYDVLQADYSRTTSERSRWGFTVSGSQVTTDRGFVTTTSTDVRATWAHVFSESLQVHVGLGLLAATTDGIASTHDSAPALDFNVSRAWPRWTLTAGGGRQLQPDGQGTLLQQDSLQVGAERRFSERFSVALGVAKARDAYFFSVYDRDYWQESVSAQWRFKRRWVLDGSLSDHGQQWVTLGLPRQTGVVSQFSISYRGG